MLRIRYVRDFAATDEIRSERTASAASDRQHRVPAVPKATECKTRSRASRAQCEPPEHRGGTQLAQSWVLRVLQKRTKKEIE